MAGFVISGEVEGKRISQLVEKLEANIDFDNDKFGIDNENETDTKQIPLRTLQNLLGKIYRPETEPSISGSTLTLNLNGNSQAIFEPRSTDLVRTISSNFTLAFTNDSTADNIICINEFTGTIIITLPTNTRCSNPSSIGTWDEIARTLELETDTADNIEFNFLYDNSSDMYNLMVSEVAL